MKGIMSSMKGMALALQVIIVVIVILVVALTVLAVFSGGLSNVAQVIGDFLEGVNPEQPSGCVQSGQPCQNIFSMCCTAGQQCTLPEGSTGTPTCQPSVRS